MLISPGSVRTVTDVGSRSGCSELLLCVVCPLLIHRAHPKNPTYLPPFKLVSGLVCGPSLLAAVVSVDNIFSPAARIDIAIQC
jgi:hypothetical protein